MDEVQHVREAAPPNEVIDIARSDAAKDPKIAPFLPNMRVITSEEKGHWTVNFARKDVYGGGVVYKIEKGTTRIVSKLYTQ